MPGSMQSIKRRMKSVESTMKITRAMQLVATSKLRKMRNLLDQQKPYYTNVSEVVQNILIHADVNDHPYLKVNDHPVSAVILITSSLGLCGGYNSNVLKCAKEHIKEDDYVYCIGTKGSHQYKHANMEFIELSSDISFTQVRFLVKQLLGMYQSNKIGSIKIVYTEFVNNLSFVPHCVTLLPVSKKMVEDKAVGEALTFEPSASVVLDTLIPQYLQATIYGYIVESVTSENASRRTSMENATDNASELIETLTLKYNQARQTAITNEISEIVAGANAQ